MDESMEESFLDDIVLNTCLGTGGYGIVFGAETLDKSTLSAVKFIRTDSSVLDEKQRKACKREATICRDLPTNKNVVRVIGVIQKFFTAEELEDLWKPEVIKKEEQHLFPDSAKAAARRQGSIPLLVIQMERCGPTLRQWLNDESVQQLKPTALSLCQYDIIRDLSEGLKFLHSKQIMHRDVKPENVMFSHNAVNNKYAHPLKIGDFGLCRMYPTTAKEVRTATLSSRVGTYDYMAPEVDTKKYGLQCDIFSLGLVVFEVAQRIPFNSRKRMFDKLTIDKQYDVIDEFVAFEGLKESIIQMTMRNSEKRMKTLDDFRVVCNVPLVKPYVRELAESLGDDIGLFSVFSAFLSELGLKGNTKTDILEVIENFYLVAFVQILQIWLIEEGEQATYSKLDFVLEGMNEWDAKLRFREWYCRKHNVKDSVGLVFQGALKQDEIRVVARLLEVSGELNIKQLYAFSENLGLSEEQTNAALFHSSFFHVFVLALMEALNAWSALVETEATFHNLIRILDNIFANNSARIVRDFCYRVSQTHVE